MYQKWEAAIFEQLINDLLNKINQNQVTQFQFNLILKEGCIKYRTLTEQLKFKKYFENQEQITKNHLKNLIVLNQTFISNNKRFYIITMKHTPQSLQHKPIKCFNWWKEWMTKKYGPDLKWFDAITMQKDCFKLKAFDFKKNLSLLLACTEHANCYGNIAAFFPKVRHYHFTKTQKNQIEFSIFMNTLKVSFYPKYMKNNALKSNLDKKFQTKNFKSQSKLSMYSILKEKNHRTATSQTIHIADWSYQDEQRGEKFQKNFRRKLLRRKSIQKSSLSYFSVPITEYLEKKKKKNYYRDQKEGKIQNFTKNSS